MRGADPVATARAAGRALCVLADDRYREDGREQPVADERGLGAALAQRVYLRFHLAGAPAAIPDDAAPAIPVLSRRFGARTYHDPGWRIVGRRGEGWQVRKDGLTLLAGPHEVRPEGEGSVAVRFPADRPWALPGWYVAISRHGQPEADRGLWRVYLHVRPVHAHAALAALVVGLERCGVRFQLKLASHPVGLARPDALVAFVAGDDLHRALHAARSLAARGHLADGTPGFAVGLDRGIAVAPEPRDSSGLSHGQWCARSVAQALVTAWRQGCEDDDERAAFVGDWLDRRWLAADEERV